MFRGCLAVVLTFTFVATLVPEVVLAERLLSGNSVGGAFAHGYIWISPDELSQLPTSGSAWNDIKRAADQGEPNTPLTPDISDQDDDTEQFLLAKVLVYKRIGESSANGYPTRYRDHILQALRDAMGTEDGGRTLAACRNVTAYIIAAELMDSEMDQQLKADFRAWANSLLTKNLDGRTITSTHEVRPNNWGTHCGTARTAIAVYTRNLADFSRATNVLRGFLGDRNAYSGFDYGGSGNDLSWQADPSRPVGINPKGSTITTASGEVISADGILPDDQRRQVEHDASCPNPNSSSFAGIMKENYVWEALQGVAGQVEILLNQGINLRGIQNAALWRAAIRLNYSQFECGDGAEEQGYPAEGDDGPLAYLINHFYGRIHMFPVPSGTIRKGKSYSFTDWTHGAPSPN